VKTQEILTFEVSNNIGSISCLEPAMFVDENMILRFSIVESIFLIQSYLIISSSPTGSAFFHKEKIQV
jgi:hypothetical protein